MSQYKHILTDFKDLRKVIGEVTKTKPAKTRYQQQAEKMGYRQEAEKKKKKWKEPLKGFPGNEDAEPADDKFAQAQKKNAEKIKKEKKHAGEEEIKKAYLALGDSAQGSVQFQRSLVQKQLAKMGYNTYSKRIFDELFAVKEEDIKTLLSLVEDRGMNDKEIDRLRKAYKGLKTVDPTSSTGKQLLGFMKKLSKEQLLDLAKAKINFISLLAVSNLVRMGVKASDIKYNKAESVDEAILRGRDYEYDEKKGVVKISKKNYAKAQKDSKGGTKQKPMMMVLTKKGTILAPVQFEEVELDIKEGGFKDIAIAIDQGDSPQKIAKKYKLDLKYVKQLFKDYEKIKKEEVDEAKQKPYVSKDKKGWHVLDGDGNISKSFGNNKNAAMNYLKKNFKKLSEDIDDGWSTIWKSLNITEGKYLKYSDLLLKKARLVAQGPIASKEITAINKAIAKEMKKLGISEEMELQEVSPAKTWWKNDPEELITYVYWARGQIPPRDKDGAYKSVVKALQKRAKAPKKDYDKHFTAFESVNEKIIRQKGPGMTRYASGLLTTISKMLDKNYSTSKISKEMGLSNKDVQVLKKWADDINNPKSAINSESRSTSVKEEHDHAKQSPFKLKSQQYPRAVPVDTDGFGKRHATVEDIISACDTFGMIIDKELQVEQVQKTLGKKGFISYKKEDLVNVFHDRETQRMILALESDLEEQEPTEYTQGEIAYAQLHEHDIEFLKPDGQKTVGPILKMSGNTFNVKDKYTGKSFTYKYSGKTTKIEEEEVKTFSEVSKPNIRSKYSTTLLKKAIAIVWDKKYAGGNMTGAYNAIEKLKKGLADDPEVAKQLWLANEEVHTEWISKDGTRRRVKELDQRKYNKLKEWEDAAEAEGDKEAYQKFFNATLKKFGVSSPDELEGDKKKKFFDYIDKNWKGDHEEKVDVHKSYKVDGRRTNFREKMKKLGYIKSQY